MFLAQSVQLCNCVQCALRGQCAPRLLCICGLVVTHKVLVIRIYGTATNCHHRHHHCRCHHQHCTYEMYSIEYRNTIINPIMLPPNAGCAADVLFILLSKAFPFLLFYLFLEFYFQNEHATHFCVFCWSFSRHRRRRYYTVLRVALFITHYTLNSKLISYWISMADGVFVLASVLGAVLQSPGQRATFSVRLMSIFTVNILYITFCSSIRYSVFSSCNAFSSTHVYVWTHFWRGGTDDDDLSSLVCSGCCSVGPVADER